MSKEAVEVAPNSKEELQKQYTSFQDILSDEEFDKMAKNVVINVMMKFEKRMS